MKKYKVNATETRTYEFIIEAKDFDDACANWCGYLSNVNSEECEKKADEDRVWETQSVKEIKE